MVRGCLIWVYKEPFRVSSVADKIASLHHAWLDFTAENQYGSTKETVVFGPNGTILESSIEEAYRKRNDAVAEKYDYVKIYDIYGNLLSIKHNDFSINSISKGLYVLKFYDHNDNCIKTCKYFKQ